MTTCLVWLPFFLCPESNFFESHEHFIVLNGKGFKTDLWDAILIFLMWLKSYAWYFAVCFRCCRFLGSFGILNQLEKASKMCRFILDCEPPPTQKKWHKEDEQEWNRNYEKTKDHKHFKTVGRKGDHGRPHTFLFALNILEIQGHLMLTWATKNSMKLSQLATHPQRPRGS